MNFASILEIHVFRPHLIHQICIAKIAKHLIFYQLIFHCLSFIPNETIFFTSKTPTILFEHPLLAMLSGLVTTFLSIPSFFYFIILFPILSTSFPLSIIFPLSTNRNHLLFFNPTTDLFQRTLHNFSRTLSH